MTSCNWITQTEAARLRNVTPAAISDLLDRKRLRCKIVSGRRLVYRRDVLNFEPRAPGAPTRVMKEAAVSAINRTEWITQREAAQLRGITTSGIRTAAKRGRIRTLKHGRVSLVNRQDILNYQPRIDFRPRHGSQNTLPNLNPEDWITVAEAAHIRGVAQGTITTHATRKRIRSIKIGNTRLIYREDIINFHDKPRPGRPKNK